MPTGCGLRNSAPRGAAAPTLPHRPGGTIARSQVRARLPTGKWERRGGRETAEG
ncbi:hypothetical protein STRIP9103_03700, partial [Streptomyces ipomoeae 91-03]